MPVLDLELADPSATLANFLAQTSAEAASLHGKKAKTPMLAGSIIGGIMGTAYIIGFTIYFVKRCKRKRLKRRIEAGKAEPKVEPEPKEKIVIPPDPAVLLGHNRPGDVIVQEKPHHHRQKSVPKVHAGEGSTSNLVRADTDRISEEVTVPANV
ncbi:hypothetical protein C8F04DRAFT_1065823 [Mycena alexandri]|uniref:Uncharacterized protein n=1 Tax=Mycena alexandri TaxID=1745969 RepID=A0AAD6TK31_9AGAR|nr:hypothetical protein C8F04DRAFT_1065823 [Mycena alexandri]